MARNELTKVLEVIIAEHDGRPPPGPDDCPTCGAKPPHKFKDLLSSKEFGISGMCQECQDGVFEGSDLC